MKHSQFEMSLEHGPFKNFRQDIIAATGELIGTTCFLLVGLGGVQTAVSSKLEAFPSPAAGYKPGTNLSQLTYISGSMGLSLLFSAWIFFRATGAAFNPNVSFALLLIGAITPTRFILYVGAQLIASIVASAFLQLLLPGPLEVTPALAPGTTQVQGLFIEAFATCALVLSVLFLAVEKHRATYLAPIGIGITLFACHMFAVAYTGAAMNSARAFGPSLVTGFKSDHWVYWYVSPARSNISAGKKRDNVTDRKGSLTRVGPTLGSLLGVAIYAFMKRFEYWKLNEGQDSDNFDGSPELFVTRAMPAGTGLSAEKTEQLHPKGLKVYKTSNPNLSADALSTRSPNKGLALDRDQQIV